MYSMEYHNRALVCPRGGETAPPDGRPDMATKKKTTTSTKKPASRQKKAAAKPKAKKAAPRKATAPAPKPGTTLTRTFKGKEIKVTVTDDGFRYGGKTYRSLTAVALAVTGYKAVSGPRFFGMVQPKSKGDA